MNKLTKVGFSALCGSLAAISAANAGELTVTGGADMTWISKNGPVTTGNGLGIGSNFNLKGSGELDNGWTFDLTIAEGNLSAFSAANINLTMGGLGKLNFNQGNSGNGIAAIDDSMPTAWEESWGAGLSTGIRLPLGSGASQNIMYTTPTLLGTTLTFTVAPQYQKTDISDKNSGGVGTANGGSYDATININPSLGTEILSGLNVFAGASTIERQDNASKDPAYEAVAGFTYDLGPVSIGGQVSGDYTGVDEAESDQTSDWNAYKAAAYGVAFNVSDDLSISYGTWTARKAGYTGIDAAVILQPGETGKEIVVESAQIAYTMGGASFRLADVQADNVSWTAGNNQSATVISLGLAF